MSEVQSDLLVATGDIDDLPLRARDGSEKRLIRINGLLKNVAGKELILVGKLEINPPCSLIVIEGLRQESREGSHLDRGRGSVGGYGDILNVAKGRVSKFYGCRTELRQRCNGRVVRKGGLELLNSVGGWGQCRGGGKRGAGGT